MFKTKIVLDEEKIMREKFATVELCLEKLREICEKLHFTEELPNLWLLAEDRDDMGALLMLLSDLETIRLIEYLKEWKVYDDEESDNGELEEDDMLLLCRQQGIIHG